MRTITKPTLLLLAGLSIGSFTFFSCSSDNSGNSSTSSTSTDDDTTVTVCETIDGEQSQSTDTEIEAMRQAMVDFRNSLSDDLLSQAYNCLDDDRFLTWTNTPNFDGDTRDGITYGDLSTSQLTAFKEMLQLFLSDDGYEKVQEITEEAEAWLEEVNSDNWSPDYYSIDLFGDPETSGSWGFQLDGHHCAINFLVNGDNVSMVPAFLAGEPAEWNAELAAEKGTGSGYDYNIFESEKANLITLYDQMTDTEKTSGVSDSSSTPSLEVGAPSEGSTDSYAGEYDYSAFETGLKYSDMSADSKANLITLMKDHVYNLSDTFAADWWTDIEANIDDTYFTLILVDGDVPSTESQFYYRIYNPYLWAEFNTEDSTGQNASTVDDWNHVHSITRIPNNPTTDNGGDYGTFALMMNNSSTKTLYEHYANADHHSKSLLIFDYKVVGLHNQHGHHHHSHI